MASNSSKSMGTIGIIGTGDYAVALTQRLSKHGCQVVCGSRNPQHPHDRLSEAQVTSVQKCILECDMIFLAIPHTSHVSLRPMERLFNGKIVIDISNKERKSEIAQAQYLQNLLPNAHVIKAFNTISAYSIESHDNDRPVYICGDDQPAKKQVQDLVRRMGLIPIDYGTLLSASELEAMPFYLFSNWQIPFILSLLSWLLWFGYTLFRHYCLEKKQDFAHTPAAMTNKVFGCTAITLLGLTYFPGCIAAILQIVKGTKYKRFPVWFDSWMKMRKQLGLFALLCACIHTVLSIILLGPGYFHHWYGMNRVVVVPVNRTTDTIIMTAAKMTWDGELCMFMGVTATALMAILGITSLPNVAAKLNWREWAFVQSSLGFLCLLLATAHVVLKAYPAWVHSPFKSVIQTITFLTCIVPFLVILLRLILALPCVSGYVARIRQGWERGVHYDSLPGLEAGAVEYVEMGDPDEGGVINPCYDDSV